MMLDSEVLRKRLNDESIIEWMDNSKDSHAYKSGFLSGLMKAINVISEEEYFKEHGCYREPIDFEFSDESINALRLITGAVSDKIKELELESHSETKIVNACISLMFTVFDRMIEHMEIMGFEHDEEEKPALRFNYFEIVQHLLLSSTKHSGGTSTIAKCKQLGFDPFEDIIFEEEEEDFSEFN